MEIQLTPKNFLNYRHIHTRVISLKVKKEQVLQNYLLNVDISLALWTFHALKQNSIFPSILLSKYNTTKGFPWCHSG